MLKCSSSKVRKQNRCQSSFWDDLSMGTEYLGTFCPEDQKSGDRISGDQIGWGLFVQWDQILGDLLSRGTGSPGINFSTILCTQFVSVLNNPVKCLKRYHVLKNVILNIIISSLQELSKTWVKEYARIRVAFDTVIQSKNKKVKSTKRSMPAVFFDSEKFQVFTQVIPLASDSDFVQSNEVLDFDTGQSSQSNPTFKASIQTKTHNDHCHSVCINCLEKTKKYHCNFYCHKMGTPR